MVNEFTVVLNQNGTNPNNYLQNRFNRRTVDPTCIYPRMRTNNTYPNVVIDVAKTSMSFGDKINRFGTTGPTGIDRTIDILTGTGLDGLSKNGIEFQPRWGIRLFRDATNKRVFYNSGDFDQNNTGRTNVIPNQPIRNSLNRRGRYNQ
jgi:hypothetical protein